MTIRKITDHKENYLGRIAIIILFIVGITMLAIVILTKFSDDYNMNCCNEFNATYVFYECQCNVMMPCNNLSCGSFCRFPDGHLESIDKIKCSINSTI